jgi:glycosyltransferase involved in cell wall biosynthesis
VRLEHQELLALMARSDVLAWPGIGEAYGITYLEAQACGLPVVACSNRGVTDVTRDGVTALLCPPDDPGALRSGHHEAGQ